MRGPAHRRSAATDQVDQLLLGHLAELELALDALLHEENLTTRAPASRRERQPPDADEPQFATSLCVCRRCAGLPCASLV